MTDSGFVVNPPTHVPVGNDIDIITKSSLQKLHAEQLSLYGPTSKEQQQDIIKAFGGFDQLLSSLWESDIIIEKKQSLYNILNDPNKYEIQKRQQNKIKKNTCDNKKEDKAQNEHQSITYSFDDNDMISRKVCNKRLAGKLPHIIFSKACNIAIVCISIATFYMPGFLLERDMISLETLFLIQTVGLIIPTIFGLCWILTINIQAFFLLIRDFTFWFKYFYLVLYLITNAWLWLRVEDEDATPIHYILSNTLFQTIMFSLTMVIDCLNINQISKVLLSMLAMFFLADNILGYQLVSLHRNEGIYQEYYEKTNVAIILPSFLNIDQLTFNIFDYAATSAQILTIFSLKQIISTILQPHKAAVLKKYPLIVYGDVNVNKSKPPSAESLKTWKIFSIGYWGFGWLYTTGLLIVIVYPGRILTILTWIMFLFIMALQYKSSIKTLHASMVIALIVLGDYAAGVLLFGWMSGITIYFISVGFGISAIYTLKVKQRLSATNDQQQSVHTLIKMTSVSSVVSSPQSGDHNGNGQTDEKEEEEENKVISTQILSENVIDATPNDHIDREKSMDSILDQNDDSHSTTMSQSVPL